MYLENRVATSRFVPIRNLHYHLLQWRVTDSTSPSPLTSPAPLVLVHGWMDVGASWQFMVDAFDSEFLRGRPVIALDWRGFGLTGPLGIPALDSLDALGACSPSDSFWFADYLADLDFLLDFVAAEFGSAQVDLIGHSMGGNIAMLYAGIRPNRIRRLINLEGFGLKAGQPEEAPGRYATWMDGLKKLHQGDMALQSYTSVNAVARRLMKTNPRLSLDKADWLAHRWARQDATSGQWHVQGHAAHKISGALVYRLEEILAIYRCISAPVLSVQASDDSLAFWWKGSYTLADYFERLALVPQAQTATLADTGHMLHHDQPQALAELVASFLMPEA